MDHFCPPEGTMNAFVKRQREHRAHAFDMGNFSSNRAALRCD
jgi:hypothetical protein